jgi:hypothetical protein
VDGRRNTRGRQIARRESELRQENRSGFGVLTCLRNRGAVAQPDLPAKSVCNILFVSPLLFFVLRLFVWPARTVCPALFVGLARVLPEPFGSGQGRGRGVLGLVSNFPLQVVHCGVHLPASTVD